MLGCLKFVWFLSLPFQYSFSISFVLLFNGCKNTLSLFQIPKHTTIPSQGPGFHGLCPRITILRDALYGFRSVNEAHVWDHSSMIQLIECGFN